MKRKWLIAVLVATALLKRLRRRRRIEHRDALLDEALAEFFPAGDPLSTTPLKP